MRIAPFSFKEFDADMVGATQRRPAAKQFLPGGRQREEVPPPPPPPPTFSEAELHDAKQDSYKKGFEAGIQEGRAQAENEQAGIDRELTGKTEQFVAAITPMFEDYRRFVLEARKAMPEVALAIARKVAAGALESGAEQIIETVALECCSTMISEPKLTVTVPARMAPTLGKKLKEMATRLQSATDIVVVGDEAMDGSDCRVEWKHGQLERNTEQLWQQIERATADIAKAADYTTDVQMEKLQQALDAPPTQDSQKE